VMVTPTSRPAFTVKEPTINVRAGPDTIYQIVGTLRQGETFEITGKNPAGDWWQFDYGSNKGWVYNQVVQVNNQVHLVAVASLPSTPTPVSPPTPRAPFTPPPDGCPLGWFYDPATNLCHSANATTSGLRRVDVMLQIESPQANSEFPLRSAVPFRIKAIGASTSPYLANQPISNLKVAVNMGPGEQCCSNNPYDIVLYTDTAGYIQGDIPLTKSVTTGPYTMFVYIPGSYSKDGFDFKGKESKQYITIRP
jgi:hypothetical protein